MRKPTFNLYPSNQGDVDSVLNTRSSELLPKFKMLLEGALRVAETNPKLRKKINKLLHAYRKGDRSDGLKKSFQRVLR